MSVVNHHDVNQNVQQIHSKNINNQNSICNVPSTSPENHVNKIQATERRLARRRKDKKKRSNENITEIKKLRAKRKDLRSKNCIFKYGIIKAREMLKEYPEEETNDRQAHITSERVELNIKRFGVYSPAEEEDSPPPIQPKLLTKMKEFR